MKCNQQTETSQAELAMVTMSNLTYVPLCASQLTDPVFSF